MKPDIHRLLELQRLLAEFSQVERVTHRKHLGEFVAENDTEHSYNLAMTGWYLANWFPELDKNLIIKYGLVHDMVEVHAGDTFLFGSAEELDSKQEREEKALKQLKKDWADFKDMTDAIDDYEARSNPEARFIYALDKIMSPMLIYLHEGYSWKKESVTADMIHAAKVEKVKLSPEIEPYFEQLHALLLQHPELFPKS